MARLLPGQNAKIDRINALVIDAREGDTDVSKEGLRSLLELFHPMILKTCKKWSNYFHDERHAIKPFDDIVADAQEWFVYYTLYKYIVDGDATYNKFISDHIDQRVRYIYERELKYFMKNIFPDPSKISDSDTDVFEDVIYKYSSNIEDENVEHNFVSEFTMDSRNKLAHKVLSFLNDTTKFNDREKVIFTEIVYNGETHDNMGSKLGISRTRVTQILRKTKSKLYKMMEDSQEIWDLIDDADISIDSEKW